MEPTSNQLYHIKELLQDLQAIFTCEGTNRRKPIMCVVCGSRLSFGKLSQLSTGAFSDLLKYFFINVSDKIREQLSKSFTFWRGKPNNSKTAKACKQNAFASKTLEEIRTKFKSRLNIHVTRNIEVSADQDDQKIQPQTPSATLLMQEGGDGYSGSPHLR